MRLASGNLATLAIIGISYYCVILKIVIWHDGIKTIKNRDFLFSLKKEQNLVSF